MILQDREIKDGIIVPITRQFEKEKPLAVTNDYIDISYLSKETAARVLSNLYPYKIKFYLYWILFNSHKIPFYHHRAASIEGIIQSFKFEDKKVRKACYRYSGVDAYHQRGLKPYEWQTNAILHTPIGQLDRFGEDYQYVLDELYYRASLNPIYRRNLNDTENKMLDHTIGEDDRALTTLTRTEYISRLYALRYCIQNTIKRKKDVMKVLKKVREEIEIKH